MDINDEVRMLREIVANDIDWFIQIEGTTSGYDCNECAEEALKEQREIEEKYKK